MTNLFYQIRNLSETELRELMDAIAMKIAEDYPDWDIYYVALHKDPVLRQQEIERIREFEKSKTAAAPSVSHVISFPGKK